MKFEWNKRYTHLAFQAAILILFTIVCIFLFLRFDTVRGFFSTALNASKPLIYAAGIAYILWPLLRFFENKVFRRLEKQRPRKRLTRTLSLIVTYIIFLAILSLFFGTVIPQISDSILTLKDKILGGYLTAALNWIDARLAENPFFSSEFIAEQIDKLNGYVSEMIDWIYNNINNIVTSVTSVAATFATEIKNILLGVVFAIYFLLFKEKLLAQIKKFFKAIFSERVYNRAEHYVMVTNRTFGGFINGKLLDSLIIGVLCFVLMSIFRMPYAPLISMIVGITNVIPFFGPFIGAIPSSFIVLIADPSMTLWFILLVLLLQQLDGNIIGPKILGDFVGLNPLWVIISITVMGGLFGVFGMFLGVPTFAVIYYIVKELTEKQLNMKGMPMETAAYFNDSAYREITEQKPKDGKRKLLPRLREKLFRKKQH